MRTNIDIDDELLKKAMQSGGFKTKREAVDEALRLYNRLEAQKEIRKWRGKLPWTGDLDEMRRD